MFFSTRGQFFGLLKCNKTAEMTAQMQNGGERTKAKFHQNIRRKA